MGEDRGFRFVQNASYDRPVPDSAAVFLGMGLLTLVTVAYGIDIVSCR